MGIFTKKPPYKQFGLSAERPESALIIPICNDDNPEDPILIEQSDKKNFLTRRKPLIQSSNRLGFSVWIIGWLALPEHILDQAASVDLYFEGKKARCLEMDIPFNLIGEVGCIPTSEVELRKDAIDILERKIPEIIKTALGDFVPKIDRPSYSRFIQPRIENLSDQVFFEWALRQGTALSKQIYQLMLQHHVFPSNYGPKTLKALLQQKAEDQASLTINATQLLSSSHSLFQLTHQDTLSLDLRSFTKRNVFLRVFNKEGGTVCFLDSSYFTILKPILKEERELSKEESKLRGWFYNGLKRSRNHKNVRIEIGRPEKLGSLPLVLVPSKHSSDPNEIREEEDWTRQAIMVLNPESNLMQCILNNSFGGDARKYISEAVLDSAILFALGDFAEEFQMKRWSHLEKLVISFKATKKRIDKLIKDRIKLQREKNKISVYLEDLQQRNTTLDHVFQERLTEEKDKLYVQIDTLVEITDSLRLQNSDLLERLKQAEVLIDDLTKSSSSSDSKDVTLIFYSYSHKDAKLREKLEIHLKGLQQKGTITTWHDRHIEAGQEWKKEIDERLEKSNIILLLVSPDFLASEYCFCIELRRALQRHKEKEACVIPVILRPCDWQSHSEIGELQCLPSNGKPVTKWSNHDDAFTEIEKGIKKVVGNIRRGHKV